MVTGKETTGAVARTEFPAGSTISGSDPTTSMVLVESPGGSDLGYGGSGMNGYAFAVDTFNFDDEPQAVSVQILGDGSSTPLAYTETGLTDTMKMFRMGLEGGKLDNPLDAAA